MVNPIEFSSGSDTVEEPMKIYRAMVDLLVPYYVASDSSFPDELQALIEEDEGICFEEEGFPDLDIFDIQEITKERAKKLIVWVDSFPDNPISLWNAFLKMKDCGVIACGEG